MRWDSLLVYVQPTATKWAVDQGLIRKQLDFSEEVVRVCNLGSKWRRKLAKENVMQEGACDSLNWVFGGCWDWMKM